jgi:hypothetical protein
MNNRTSYMQKITAKSYEKTLRIEKLIAEINAITVRIEQLRQRIAVSIAQK